MNQSCIVVLLGLPASGKSWLTERLCSFLTNNDSLVKCVTYDKIVSIEEQAKIALLSASDMTKNYRKEMKNIVESFLHSVDSLKKNVIIVDDNNYYRSMRYEYHQLATKFSTGYLQVYVQCEVSLAVFNNSRRPEKNRVPDAVITQMHSKFEVPSEPWENCLAIQSVDLSSPTILDTIRNRVHEAISNPIITLEQLETKKCLALQSKMLNDRNIVHNMDKVLRKAVGERIRQRKEENSHVLAAQLNKIRLSIMEGVQTGNVRIPSSILASDGTINLQDLELWTVSVFLQRCHSDSS